MSKQISLFGIFLRNTELVASEGEWQNEEEPWPAQDLAPSPFFFLAGHSSIGLLHL